MRRLRGKGAIGQVSAVSPLNFSDEIRSDMELPKRVKLVDMSLKEGLQLEGMALSKEQCLYVASKLDDLGVPSLNVAFRLHRTEDIELMNALSKLHLKAEVLVAVSNHQHPPLYSHAKKTEAIDRILDFGHVPYVTFPLANTLLQGFAEFRGEKNNSLRYLKDREVQLAVETVAHVKNKGGRISFNLQDPMRCDLPFLDRVCKELADAGAYYLSFDDLAMPGIPAVFKYIVRRAKKAAPKGTFGWYVHDDYGFGLGAALASIEGGAEVQLCTINGYGKRSGMVDLGHLATVLELMYGYNTGIKLEKLYDLCRLFADIYGRPIPQTRALFGSSAFTHGADWHVQWAFNPDHPNNPDYPWVVHSMAPELVGRKARIALYSGSGEMGIRVKAAEFGIDLSVEEAEKVRLELRNELVMRKRPLEDEEFVKIVQRSLPNKAISRR